MAKVMQLDLRWAYIHWAPEIGNKDTKRASAEESDMNFS